MIGWTHPTFGPIGVLRGASRSEKVWKHFYDPDEHWERLCGVDVAPMRSEAEEVSGVSRERALELPELMGPRRTHTDELLRAHHDAYFAPAYCSEMSAPQTIWTSAIDSERRIKALTPRSVFLSVKVGRSSGRLITVFRPHPMTRGVDWDETDLRRHGVWYFEKDTGMNTNELARTVAAGLRRVSNRPSTAKELWWLASALGYGRILRNVPDVGELLPVAEAAFAETPESIVKELRLSLNWGLLVDRLAAAMQDANFDSLEAVLSDSEDLLMVASVVGSESSAEEFCDEAEMLLPWLPAEWSHIAERARRRLQLVGEQPSPVARLWCALEDAGTAALVREADAVRRPTSRLVDEILPPQPRWSIWWDRIADLVGRGTAVATSWIDRSFEDLTLAPLAPTMGGASVANEEWAVRGRPAPGAPHYRIFVVDEAHPDGWEVTPHFTEADGELWRLEANERALVVIIAGERPLAGLSMAQVLQGASTRDDVVARAREIQPTHETNARR